MLIYLLEKNPSDFYVKIQVQYKHSSFTEYDKSSKFYMLVFRQWKA